VLQVSRAEAGVGIGRIGEQGAQIAHRVCPLVEASNDSQADRYICAVRIANEVERIGHRVDAIAEQVAEGGRPNHRDEQIGSGLGAIAAEGIAERADVMWKSGGACDINHATDSHRRIDHEPDRRRASAGRS
jgi:hypothetical protein